MKERLTNQEITETATGGGERLHLPFNPCAPNIATITAVDLN
jgi:hypothetical protein